MLIKNLYTELGQGIRKLERAVRRKTKSWKVLSWKVRHEIEKNEIGKF